MVVGQEILFPLHSSSWLTKNRVWLASSIAIIMNSATDKPLPHTCVLVYVLNSVQTTNMGI